MKNKLINLMLVKSHYCEKNSIIQNNLKYIKPALQIIHKCHVNNKKILFVGMPKYYSYKIKTSKHVFVPDSVWVKGILTNNKQIANYFNKKSQNKKNNIKKLKFLFNLTQKPDLIVILNKNKTPKMLEEGYLARIPVITLNNDILPIRDFKSSYKTPENILNEANKNFFIPFIISILKKKKKNVNLIKKKLIYIYKKRKWVFSKTKPFKH